jgi:hypothetical protein
MRKASIGTFMRQGQEGSLTVERGVANVMVRASLNIILLTIAGGNLYLAIHLYGQLARGRVRLVSSPPLLSVSTCLHDHDMWMIAN